MNVRITVELDIDEGEAKDVERAARLANLVWYSAAAMFEGKTPDVWLEPRSLMGPVKLAEQEIGAVTKTWKLT